MATSTRGHFRMETPVPPRFSEYSDLCASPLFLWAHRKKINRSSYLKPGKRLKINPDLCRQASHLALVLISEACLWLRGVTV